LALDIIKKKTYHPENLVTFRIPTCATSSVSVISFRTASSPSASSKFEKVKPSPFEETALKISTQPFACVSTAAQNEVTKIANCANNYRKMFINQTRLGNKMYKLPDAHPPRKFFAEFNKYSFRS
jgi:hypothetical protein